MHSDIVTGLFVGRAERRWPGRPASAIGKRPVAADEAPLILETEGFLLDEQADPRVHGGPDKAVHHYAAGHYAAWRAEFPRLAARLVPGGFGENLSTGAGGADGEPWDETSVCIGDVFELGTALVQVTQGRQPCWKLNAPPTMVRRFASRRNATAWSPDGWTLAASSRPRSSVTLLTAITMPPTTRASAPKAIKKTRTREV